MSTSTQPQRVQSARCMSKFERMFAVHAAQRTEDAECAWRAAIELLPDLHKQRNRWCDCWWRWRCICCSSASAASPTTQSHERHTSFARVERRRAASRARGGGASGAVARAACVCKFASATGPTIRVIRGYYSSYYDHQTTRTLRLQHIKASAMESSNRDDVVPLPAGNMLRCGCPLGRPCTCEMGATRRGQRDAVFACGECVNCRLNAAKATSSTSSRRPTAAAGANTRRCLRYNEFVASQQFEQLELSPDCVLRMRRPDWACVPCA